MFVAKQYLPDMILQLHKWTYNVQDLQKTKPAEIPEWMGGIVPEFSPYQEVILYLLLGMGESPFFRDMNSERLPMLQ